MARLFLRVRSESIYSEEYRPVDRSNYVTDKEIQKAMVQFAGCERSGRRIGRQDDSSSLA